MLLVLYSGFSDDLSLLVIKELLELWEDVLHRPLLSYVSRNSEEVGAHLFPHLPVQVLADEAQYLGFLLRLCEKESFEDICRAE